MTFVRGSTTCQQTRHTLAGKTSTPTVVHGRPSSHIPYADTAVVKRRDHVLTSRSAVRQNADAGSFSHFSPVFATLVGQIDPIYVHVGMPVDVFLVVVHAFTRKPRFPTCQSSTSSPSIPMARIDSIRQKPGRGTSVIQARYCVSQGVQMRVMPISQLLASP